MKKCQQIRYRGRQLKRETVKLNILLETRSVPMKLDPFYRLVYYYQWL
jgi:hypothetical protein